jgi:hypothetical protein
MLAMLESRFAGWLAKSPTPFSTHDQSQPAAAVVTMRHDAFLLPKAPGLLKACPDRNRRVLGNVANWPKVRFAPTTAIKQECFYLTDALLLTDQSKLTNYNPWQGQGNLIVMQP